MYRFCIFGKNNEKHKFSLYFFINICYNIHKNKPRGENMAKLYFKYGAMGSSKTAQALITKFNYEERGMKVWLIKPAIDKRDGENVVKSRVGLCETCDVIEKDEELYEVFETKKISADVIIADECQFFTEEQIYSLRRIVDEFDIPVLCFGLFPADV